ncbi:MAG: hypothetical protein JNL83_18950 [Myxococcales bacterium]|nr:hypothetical protein [Myxococcales bacterium]
MTRLFLVLIALAACARRPAPREPSERALFRDLERQVTVASTTGWRVDRFEVDSLVNAAMDSACRVDALDRRGLLAWLDAEIHRRGGPVEVAYAKRGKQLSAVEDLLVLTRVQKLLARADELSLDCPFWLEPERPFHGRQISDGKWLLSFGGGGKGTLSLQGDSMDLKFGGAGRLLLGKMFSDERGLFTGLEAGASAAFPKNAMGERDSLELGVDLVTPVVYRRVLLNAYYEFEIGYLGRATERDWTAFDHGVHAGFAVGARGLRTRFVFPGAAVGISWERTFLDGDDATTIKIGARVAFDLEL